MGMNSDSLLIQYFFEGFIEVEKHLSMARDNFVQA